ncbi:unnamed protein product, partial [Discosporangium mesarthrocarpum]
VFTGSVTAGVAGGRPRDFPPWASPDREEDFARLAVHVPSLVQISDLGDASRWQRWATSPECEQDFPNIRGMTHFQRVLLVQALRPD